MHILSFFTPFCKTFTLGYYTSGETTRGKYKEPQAGQAIRVVLLNRGEKQKWKRLKRRIQVKEGQKGKTYSRWYSHVVTHRSTNHPVRSLSTGERTGTSVFCDLWPYVVVDGLEINIDAQFTILFVPTKLKQ